MLESIKYLQSVGRYDIVKPDPELKLKPLTLIFSENGRGKTTFCAVLRSLVSGDPEHILARRRLSSKKSPRVVLSAMGKDVIFDGQKWSASGLQAMIFDDHFVESNVHSGLTISSGQRQNLHGLILGEDGVSLNRQVQALTDTIATLQKELRLKEQAIPAAALGDFDIDTFCNLGQHHDLDEQLASAKAAASVLLNAESIKTAPLFEAIALPTVDEKHLEDVLVGGLPDVESQALAAVAAHLRGLDDVAAEDWVSTGMRLTEQRTRTTCPFCSQELKRSTLLEHYRAYFSAAYTNQKSRIAKAKSGVLDQLGGDQLAHFQRRLERQKERHAFWSKYLRLPTFAIDTDEIVRSWTTLRDSLTTILDAKAAAPLDPRPVDTDLRNAIVAHRQVAKKVHELSTSLLATNEDIAASKERAAHGSLPAARAQLSVLEAIERRWSTDLSGKCAEYLDVRAAKNAAENDKAAARKALDIHRRKVFETHETSINSFLLKFNADFRIDALAPLDPKGVPSSSYQLVINKHRVGLGTGTLSAPAFGNTLSAGDRTTLALAFFFATLQHRSTLDGVVVVLDDPASSLDEGRALATVQEIRRIAAKAAQVIVLSHSRQLLGPIWEKADKEATSSFQIRDCGEESSHFEPWNAEATALTEFDRQHRSIREYVNDSAGDPEKIAPYLRFVLEGYLRVAFNEHFAPGWILKDFTSRAKQLKDSKAPILSDEDLNELDDLREYANGFHHDSSKSWQENISNINQTQLKGYAKRVLEFTRLRYSQ